MPFAQGSRQGLSFVPEVTFGTTPGTPPMKNFRYTGGSPNLQKATAQSAEIRSDRQISSLRHGSESVAGELAFELSYGTFDDWLAAALFGSWSTNVLKAGTTLQSFTMERRLTDITQYVPYRGVCVNSLSLSLPAEGMVTGTFGIVGKEQGTSSGTSLGTPTEVTTNEPFAGFEGALTEGGVSIAVVTALELTLENGIAGNPVVGNRFSPQMSFGRSNLTGTVSAYIENMTLFNKFVNETESSLTVTLSDAAGNDLLINIPRLKYTGAEIPASESGSLVLSMPFQALYDTGQASNIVITRTPA